MTDFPSGARTIPGAHSGGTLLGGPPRCTWHITWDQLDPRPAFNDVAGYLVRMNYEPTILWNPEDGDIIGLVPASRSAYAVRNLTGGVETNRYGDVHVQIEVFFSPGYQGRRLFTDGPLVGLDHIMRWLDDLGVPRNAACDWANPTRDTQQWLNNAGHFGHFAVPENNHSDPVAGTDIAKILAAGRSHPIEGDVDMTPGQCRDKTGRKWFFVVGDNGRCYASISGGTFFPLELHNDAGDPADIVWTSGLDAYLETDGTIVLAGRGGDGALWQVLVYTDGSPHPGKPPVLNRVGGHIFPAA